MISLEKLRILTPLRKLLKNVRDLGKLIVAKGLKKLPKVQKIAQSGHTAYNTSLRPLQRVLRFRKRQAKSKEKIIYDEFSSVCSRRTQRRFLHSSSSFSKRIISENMKKEGIKKQRRGVKMVERERKEDETKCFRDEQNKIVGLVGKNNCT